MSRYTDMPNRPLYPFGYGLSYTDYTYNQIQADKVEFKQGESLQVWVTVKNTVTHTCRLKKKKRCAL